MAEAPKGNIIIIKKKKGGGHGGAHGGAWKVAYADFVTAMMAFFMVMWLMGADEETKAAVQSYFEGQKLGTDSLNPNGVMHGGDSSHREQGAQGRYEEEMLERPHFTAPVELEEMQVLRDLSDTYDGASFSRDVDGDVVKFEINYRIYFEEGSSAIPSDPRQQEVMAKMASILRSFNGQVVIEGHSDGNQDWKLAWERAFNIRQFFFEKYKVNPDKMIPLAAFRAKPAGQVETLSQIERRSVRFVLKRDRGQGRP